jgi:hypothetical protein
MKTIEVSDEDYKTLMELSRELQLQDNHSQAFPYFWESCSEKLIRDPNDEGEIRQVYDYDAEESYTVEEYAENNHKVWLSFLKYNNIEEKQYHSKFGRRFGEYLSVHYSCASYSSNLEQVSEHNPSLFLSDVTKYIFNNQHHLGKCPRTYARTVQRMPKMVKLVEAIYRLNPQLEEFVNHEAKHVVFLIE